MNDITYTELLQVVRSVRRRWRGRNLLRGGLIVLCVGFVAFATSVWAMDYLLYTESAVTWMRILTWVALAALALRFLLLPLLQKASDQQVALYIEEHEPELQSSVISAVELGESGGAPSSDMERQLLVDAIRRCEEIDYAKGIERGRLQRFSGALAGASLAGLVAVLLSPAFLQHGALLLFMPWKAMAADNPYRVEVHPGDVEFARGSDLRIAARLVEFSSEVVDVLHRYDGDEQWERTPLLSGDVTDVLGESEANVQDFDVTFFDLQDNLEYFVEAGSLRSDTYRVEVRDLPYVESIDLQYRFPKYSGLSDKVVEDGGDIAALPGTQVTLTVKPTFQVPTGRVLLEEGGEVPLVLGENGQFTVDLEVTERDYYRIELDEPDGTAHRASAEYAITVLDDMPPSLMVTKPGRDVRANKIEEVFTEILAEDDYGIGQLELFFSVNGGEEQRVSLAGGRSSRKSVTAGHTFYLEEFDLEDGDFISYYARAADRRASGGRQETTSDIYFVEIRPFGQDYRRAEAGGMPGGGGGGVDSTLSDQQRQVIAATFRVQRDGYTWTPKERSESLATVALTQERLREQVLSLAARMGNRGTLLEEQDFQKIIEELGNAAEAMEPAQKLLREEKPKEALGPEQKALSHLQRAEAVFRDVRVSFDPSGGGGGGGEQQRLSEDLADLFELELDKLRNQYETVQRGEQQQVDREVDEIAQKLRELARRQQQQNERQQQMQRRGGSGGSSSPAQQKLADEAEELARELERLSRENRRPELQQSAQRLRDAARNMRSGSAEGRQENSTGGSGLASVDQLREARRLLDKSRKQQSARDMEQLQQQADRIQQNQQRIGDQVRERAEREAAGQGGRGGEAEREELDRLKERKDELAKDIASLESELDRMARQIRADQPDAARELRRAADAIRDNQIKEKVQYSKGVLEQRDASFANAFEEQIGNDIATLGEQMGRATGALGQSDEERKGDALEQARELVEKLESLGGRLAEKSSTEGAGDPDGKTGGSTPGGPPGEGGQESGGEESGSADGQAGDGGPGRGRRLEQRAGRGLEGGDPEEGSDASSRSQAGAAISSGGPTSVGSGEGTSFQPGTLSNSEVRQAQSELRQRLKEGQELSRELSSLGLETQDLDQILRQMNRFQIREINNDPLALERLKQDIVEGLRQFEFRVWRELEGNREGEIRLSAEDQIPEEYRESVAEYFKSLAQE
ncbi:MAG: hypothetical protein AAF690_28425 [Acidobacteriota bacterium]